MNFSKRTFDAYLELSKPRILSLILVTTALGFILADQSHIRWVRLFVTLVGAALICAGSGALNHYLERDSDGKMRRTATRPLPQGIVCPNNAMLFGIIMVLAGVSVLYVQVNLLTAFLSLLTAFLYVIVYTPMKKVSWLNTSIGAIPGAIPPLGGWAAATNQLDLGAWVLFLILFLWQHPHFFAIAWMYKEDYKQAGFKMLPVLEPDGKKTFWIIVLSSLVLLPISLMPSVLQMTGAIYFWGALAAGVWLLYQSRLLQKTHSVIHAHKLLKATVIYLPLLLLLIVLDVSILK